MDFIPPWCPNTACPNHTTPQPNFFRRNGSYTPTCPPRTCPRFRCRAYYQWILACATTRFDRGDRRPKCPMKSSFRLLTSGVGLRQCSRLPESARLRSAAKTLQARATVRSNAGQPLSFAPCLGGTYLIDEEETYEAASIRTLTVPVLIERSTWFVVSAFAAAPIRRLAPGTARRNWRDQRRGGERTNVGTAARWQSTRHCAACVIWQRRVRCSCRRTRRPPTVP